MVNSEDYAALYAALDATLFRRCIVSTLKSLAEGLHRLINLNHFELYNCGCIVSLPIVGLPTYCLTYLAFQELEKMEALPDNPHTLSSLKKLTIHNCPNLISFPSNGLLSNLTFLQISSKHLFECGLDRLNSLEELCIYGGIGERRRILWDKTRTILPLSLTSLEIRDFPNLKYISISGFCYLTSLVISDCPKLASFRKNDLPDSLRYLEIKSCPKLDSFLKDSLQDSLLYLEVNGRPPIEKPRQEGKRPKWFKILHIP